MYILTSICNKYFLPETFCLCLFCCKKIAIIKGRQFTGANISLLLEIINDNRKNKALNKFLMQLWPTDHFRLTSGNNSISLGSNFPSNYKKWEHYISNIHYRLIGNVFCASFGLNQQKREKIAWLLSPRDDYFSESWSYLLSCLGQFFSSKFLEFRTEFQFSQKTYHTSHHRS